MHRIKYLIELDSLENLNLEIGYYCCFPIFPVSQIDKGLVELPELYRTDNESLNSISKLLLGFEKKIKTDIQSEATLLCCKIGHEEDPYLFDDPENDQLVDEFNFKADEIRKREILEATDRVDIAEQELKTLLNSEFFDVA